MIAALASVALACFTSMLVAMFSAFRLAEKLEQAEATIHRLRREKVRAFVRARCESSEPPPWVNGD
jgi:hypothetical protein